MACLSALAAGLMGLVGHYTGTDSLPDSGLYSAWISTVASILGIVFRMEAKHILTLARRPKEEKDQETTHDDDDSEPTGHDSEPADDDDEPDDS